MEEYHLVSLNGPWKETESHILIGAPSENQLISFFLSFLSNLSKKYDLSCRNLTINDERIYTKDEKLSLIIGTTTRWEEKYYDLRIKLRVKSLSPSVVSEDLEKFLTHEDSGIRKFTKDYLKDRKDENI